MVESASAQINATATSATTYQYNLTLQDTGTTPIGTFWFAWNALPDEDLLPLSPTLVPAPLGWTALILHAGAGDGYSIQWTANTPASDLIPGSSLSGFAFSTVTPPVTILSGSTIDPIYATTQSFVYGGVPFSDAGASFAAIGTVSPTIVSNAAVAILRTQPNSTVLGTAINQLATGQQTLGQYETSLITSEQALYSSLPALVTVDAFYGATSQSSILDTIAASAGSPSQVGGFYTATYLHNLGYSDPNVWTIIASQWGADPTSAFFKEFNSFGTDFSGFISAVYQREFGFAPSAANLQNLVNDVSGVQALLGGGSGAATPIQVVSGIYGYLLYIGQTTPSLPTQYGTAADAFLQAAANGTVKYGEELTQQFPSGGTASIISSAMADPSVITVSSPDQLIDPGAGSFSIQFQPGASAGTLVLHNGGVDQASGFDPATDVLDVRALLTGTGLALTSDIASLSGYLTIADQGTNALLRFDPTGQGGGGTVAVLQGLGSTVTGLDSLTAHGAIRNA